METWRIVVAMLIVSLIVVGAPALIVLLSVKLSLPKVGIVKGIFTFLFTALVLSIFLPAFFSVPAAFTITFIAYKQQYFDAAETKSKTNETSS